VHLDSFQCFEKFIALTGRQNGASCIYVMLLPEGGGKGPVHPVIFPGMLKSRGFLTTPHTKAAAQTLFSVSLGGNDLFKTDTLRLHYTSYTIPGRDYNYHVPTRAPWTSRALNTTTPRSTARSRSFPRNARCRSPWCIARTCIHRG
ncbi:Hypothetical protein (Fragment), partial [Durusdinium trenchii]